MTARPVIGGWRIGRRTFLKALGLSGVALAAGTSLPMASRGADGTLAAASRIDELALALEFDIERIFRFVSEQIRYEPYAGVLRGAEGTLMARAGNSADQAVLLAALMKASGLACRFAEAPIDAMEAAALLGRAAIDVTTARDEFVDVLTGRAQGGRLLVVPELDAETRARVQDVQEQAEPVVQWATARLGETASMVETALAEAGVALPAGFSPLPAPERDRHFWVQVASGPAWLDLDPSLLGALPGDVIATAALLHEQVPDELRHRVTFEVIAEVIGGDGLTEEVLLAVNDFADVLAGLPIGILNVELNGLKAIGAGIASALEGGTTYLPCLIAGEDVVVGPGAIRFGGDPASDPFGELAAGSPVPAVGEPTAEWIRVTIASPGAEPVVVRREIFDRVGPAARSAGAPDLDALPAAQLVQLDPDGPPDYVPAQRSLWLTVHTGTLGGRALSDAFARREVEDRLTNVVRGFHVAREACAIEAGLGLGTRTFVAGPNIAALTVDLEPGPGDALGARAGMDIWRRDFGTAPVPGMAEQHPSGLVAGMLPHIVERLMLGEANAERTEEPAVSVGLILEAARARGIGIRVLTSPNDVDALPYPADARARLRAALGDGRLAVVPEASVPFGDEERVGWWLIDPRTGSAADELDDGRGASEWITILLGPMRAMPAFLRLGLCAAFGFELAGLVITSVLGLGIMSGSTDERRRMVGGAVAAVSIPGAAGAGVGAAACLFGA